MYSIKKENIRQDLKDYLDKKAFSQRHLAIGENNLIHPVHPVQ